MLFMARIYRPLYRLLSIEYLFCPSLLIFLYLVKSRPDIHNCSPHLHIIFARGQISGQSAALSHPAHENSLAEWPVTRKEHHDTDLEHCTFHTSSLMNVSWFVVDNIWPSIMDCVVGLCQSTTIA